MATVVNTPAHETTDSSGVAIGVIVGIIVAVLVAAVIFLIYGRPMMFEGNQQQIPAQQQQQQNQNQNPNPSQAVPEGQTPPPGANPSTY